MGGDDHRHAHGDASFDDPPLNDRQVFHWAFDPEITAGDHHQIGGANDLVDILDGELVLDFGHDSRAALMFPEDGPEHLDVVRFTAKTEREKIDAELGADGDIRMIFGGQRRQIDFHAREIEMAPVSERAFGHNLATDPCSPLLDDPHVDDPVVDQHGVADGNIVDQAVIVDADAIDLLAPLTPDGEIEGVARFQIEFGG